MSNFTKIVLGKLEDERTRQEELDKEDNHSWAVWLMLLLDYTGRVSNVLFRMLFDSDITADVLFDSLVEVGAVCVAWLEHILRSVDLEIDTIVSDTDGDKE